MKNILIPIGICLMCFIACVDTEPLPVMIDGLKPIYRDINKEDIQSVDARMFGDLGKIVYVDPYIFINELYSGIHVVDNSDPTDPQQIVFWSIPGNTDFTIDGNWLYADNSRDLYTIDIIDIYNIKKVFTNSDLYFQIASSQMYPPDFNGSFECVDATKGTVVGWKAEELTDPKCWR